MNSAYMEWNLPPHLNHVAALPCQIRASAILQKKLTLYYYLLVMRKMLLRYGLVFANSDTYWFIILRHDVKIMPFQQVSAGQCTCTSRCVEKKPADFNPLDFFLTPNSPTSLYPLDYQICTAIQGRIYYTNIGWKDCQHAFMRKVLIA